MALQAQLTAQLVSGPAQISDTQFPGAVVNASFGLQPPNKSYNVAVGGSPVIASPPPTFVAISGIGSSGEVTQATTLYLRTGTNQFLVQLTCSDPLGGGDRVSVIPVVGTMLLEFPSNGYLKGLSVSGSGSLEFWASGNS